jgi:PAS domain S-box-containing protein
MPEAETDLETPALSHLVDPADLLDLLQGVDDLVQSVWPDGRIRYVNRAWLERLGYSAEEAADLNIFGVTHPESHEHCAHYLGRLFGGEDVGLMEVTFVTKSGEPVQLEGRVTARFSNGTPYATRGIFREVKPRERVRGTLDRLREQRRLFHSVLSILRANTSRSRDVFLELVTKKVAQSLKVERVSVWLFDDLHTQITCNYLIEGHSTRGRSGEVLHRSDYPAYFEAIEGLLPIRADDARQHGATSSLTEKYLDPHGITSIFDCPIRLGDHLAGVLCCEHVGEPRHWTNDEEEFLVAVSAIVLIFLENERRVRVESELSALNQRLERLVDDRTAELNRSEKRLQYLITSSPAILFSCHASEGYPTTYISPNVEVFLGYSVRDFLSTPDFWTQRLHPDDRTRALSAMASAVVYGSAAFEYRFLHADGQYRWLRDSLMLTRDAEGNPKEIVGSCIDIDDRRRAENAAQAAANDLRRLIETANAPIFGKDVRGKVNEWNRSAERLTGFSKEDVFNRDLVDFVSPGYKLAVKEVLDRALRGVETENFEFPLETKDGRRVTVLLNAGTRRGSEGEITGMVGVGQDITQLRQADQRSLRAKRLESLGTLAGGVAHDINNALAPIMLACGLLRKQAPDAARLIDILESSTRRGASMVQQLLTFAKGVDGERIAIDPRKLTRELEQIVSSTFPKNIRLRFSIGDELPSVIGDATQLHQVLLNLCVNARDAMPTGGAITIELSGVTVSTREAAEHDDCSPGRYLRWSVTDSGSGISTELLERIFEPFFSTKSPEQGTGLGLSTAMGIVRSHGGFMRVATQPGLGSTFSVYLPEAIGVEATNEKVHATRPFRGQGETILVVEDEPSVREVVRQILTALGFKVRVAVDGVSALSALAEPMNTIDGVITDLHMPNMDGIELARKVAVAYPSLGVILASGRLDRAELAAAEDAPFVAHLEKPFTIERLSEALRVLLTQPTTAKPDRHGA